MEAYPAVIMEYFNGEKQYVIPLFQRPYTWDKLKWNALWEDILAHCDSEGNSPPHFMAAIVSVPARSVPVGVVKHLVIDGQQRLTTLALLLCAMRDRFREEGDVKNADRLDDYLVNRHHEGPDRLKLLPTHADQQVYVSILKGNGYEVPCHRMQECHAWFVENLKNPIVTENGDQITLIDILNTITRLLQVVMINLGDVDDPYQIFESLNAKGEPLAQADLVRNFVLMRFKNSLGPGGEQERVYEKYWHPLENNLRAADLSEFFRHYASRLGRNVKKPKVYAEIKSLFASAGQEEAERELQQMCTHSELYRQLLHPQTNTAVGAKLAAFLEASVAHPLLLRLLYSNYCERLPEADLLGCLTAMDSVMIRRAVMQIHRGPLNKLFVSLAGKYPENDILNWLHNELSVRVRTERWPRDDEFTKALVENELYDKKPVKVLLEAFEGSLEAKEPVDLSKATVEHIMPQHLTEEWKAMLGPSADEIHRKYVHTIGNLTLSAYNPELSDGPFQHKVNIYANSNIQMNRKIAQNEKWAAEEICNRAREIAALAVTIWPGPE